MNAMQQMAHRENAATRAKWDNGNAYARECEVERIFQDTKTPASMKKIAAIVDEVARATGIPAHEIKAKNGPHLVSKARRYCFFLARREGYACKVIAAYFGCDHSTVVNGYQKIGKMLGAAQ